MRMQNTSITKTLKTLSIKPGKNETFVNRVANHKLLKINLGIIAVKRCPLDDFQSTTKFSLGLEAKKTVLKVFILIILCIKLKHLYIKT